MNDEQKAFIDRIESKKSELFEMVKNFLGCEAVVIIPLESKMPCEEEKKSGKCTNPHITGLMVDGIAPRYLEALLEQTLEGLKGNVISNF